jgi:hypothetical protein
MTAAAAERALPRPVAAITGASSGIGMEFARRLAPDYDLLLVARRQAPLEALAGELRDRHGCNAAVLAADLTDGEQLRGVEARLAAEPHLALLVNNAGFGLRGPFWQVDLALIERMHQLHITAVTRLTHAALRALVIRDRGAVINVASVAAFAPRAGSAAYGSSKNWLTTLTEGIHLDLRRAHSAVTVQALCPGFTYSEFHDLLGEDRRRLAPAFMWLTAGQVVDASLAGLKRRKVFVVPGWRYRIIVAVLSKLPQWLKLRVL